MAYPIYYSLLHEDDLIPPAGGDRVMCWGMAAFSTTDTSVAILASTLQTLESCQLTIHDGTPVANDLLSHNGLTSPSTGVTCYRPAGTTSGLTFDYIALGTRIIA